MPTTQSEDPNEQVRHPRHYNQHPSGIECIEIIEHLPCNLANAVKYIWRCGLKQSTDPLRDLRSAQWYILRERGRIKRFDRTHTAYAQTPRADAVWCGLAQQIVQDALKRGDQDNLLAACLDALLRDDLAVMLERLEREIRSDLMVKGCTAL